MQVATPVLPPAPVKSATTFLLSVRLPNGVCLEVGQTSAEELETIVQVLGRLACSGSTLTSPKSSSTSFGNRTWSASAIDETGVDGVDGDTGAGMTGTNAGKVLALPGLLTVGAGMSTETPSITIGSGSRGSCRI